MLDQITPLILTYNEAPNIGRNLEKLYWARDVVVVDSFSNDETLETISRFAKVRVVQRRFDGFANQCNFGLTEVKTDWVLSLDADYIITEEFIAELNRLELGNEVSGFRSHFKYCINGNVIRSGIYPPVVVLFKREQSIYLEDGHAHRVSVKGQIKDLHSSILHDDRKPLSRWFQSQQQYTKLEAQKLLRTNAGDLGWTDRLRRLKIFAPLAVVFYCLIIRGGILDGWPGFYYAFQRMIAELMLSLELLEADLRGQRPEVRDQKEIANCELRIAEPQREAAK